MGDVRIKLLQIDMIRNVSENLRAIACMDDTSFNDISGIIHKLDSLADNIEKNIYFNRGLSQSCENFPSANNHTRLIVV